MHPRIAAAQVTGPLRLHLRFTDGSDGTVNLATMLRGRAGVLAALQDPAFFSQVSVDAEAGTVVWPNGVDLDPDVLYEAARGVAGAVGA
jgi:hypothetical protein